MANQLPSYVLINVNTHKQIGPIWPSASAAGVKWKPGQAVVRFRADLGDGDVIFDPLSPVEFDRVARAIGAAARLPL